MLKKCAHRLYYCSTDGNLTIRRIKQEQSFFFAHRETLSSDTKCFLLLDGLFAYGVAMSTTFLTSRICSIHKGFRVDVRFSYCVVDVYGREVKLSSVTLDFFKYPQTQYLQGVQALLPIFLLCNRYIRKIVKNDRFLYIPSKFYSRNSYILQGFLDFCLIPYYEEKVSNEDVCVDRPK